MGDQQVTQIQRYQIYARHDVRMSRRQIAKGLGNRNSTVSRKMRRNACASGYDPEQAQSRSDQRRRNAWKWTMALAKHDLRRLREDWNPEKISGLMAPLSDVGVSYILLCDDKARGGDLWQTSASLSGAASTMPRLRAWDSALFPTAWVSGIVG